MSKFRECGWALLQTDRVAGEGNGSVIVFNRHQPICQIRSTAFHRQRFRQTNIVAGGGSLGLGVNVKIP